MRRARWAVGAVVLALTACSGTPAPAPAAEPSTLAAYYAQHLNWQACDGGFEQIKAAGAPPILVVGTLRDPATPYRWAQAMAGDLASGVLLGWNGDGHTAYGESSACVDTIVNDYLIDLAVPRSGTVCQH